MLALARAGHLPWGAVFRTTAKVEKQCPRLCRPRDFQKNYQYLAQEVLSIVKYILNVNAR